MSRCIEMGNLGIRPNNVSGKIGYKPLVLLTPREMQILEMICDGMSNDEIAKQLDIRAQTVKFHLKKVYDVFHANKRHTVIIEAVKTGLVRPNWIPGLVSTV